MDCRKCANYEPTEVERPDDHPGRIFAEDLRVGMVIRRHGMPQIRELVVILGKVEGNTVPSLQLLAGCEPAKCALWLASAGLKPYDDTGRWHHSAWCEEVT